MRKLVIAILLMTTSSFANAQTESVAMSLVKCTEYNEKIDTKIDYTIYSDIDLKSGKGIVVSNLDDLSIAYNVEIKTTGQDKNLLLEAISQTEFTTDVISVHLGDKVSGVRKTTLKKPQAKEQSYPLECKIIDLGI
jgi:hypothetical protein